MRHFAVIFGFTMLLSVYAAAQDCPMVSVTGPAGIVPVGGLARYTVTLVGYEDKTASLEYSWSTSAGMIVRGQGTTSIDIRQPDQSLTVTVEVKGLPQGCPNAASEVCCGGVPPEAAKLGEYLGPIPEGLLVEIARAFGDHPSDQLYVLSRRIRGKPTASSDSRERSLLARLISKGITPDRVTMTAVFADTELIQVWRVPPGANSPTCDGCEVSEKAKDCPQIIVTGPAGVSLPEDIMTFSADLKGTSPTGLTFRWTVDAGVIVRGEDTHLLKARYTDQRKFKATVSVMGLPPGCPTEAFEVLNMSGPHEVPDRLGAISNTTYTIDKVLLKRISESLKSNQTSQLYVWIYFGKSEDRFPKLKAHLLQQLSKTKIDPSRFTIAGSPEKPRGAVFWRVPPGTDDPAP